MMTRSIQSLIRGIRFVRQNPATILPLVFVLVTCGLFLYSGQQFLAAGTANHDRLQKDRIGLLQDSFAVLITALDYSTEALNESVRSIALQNPDITKFRIISGTAEGYRTEVALDSTLIGSEVVSVEPLLLARGYPNETVISPYVINDTRRWQAVRYSEAPDGTEWYIFTELSLAQVDSLMAQNIARAYWSLLPVLLFVSFFAYWQYRNTDYRRLFLIATEANKTRDLFTNMITHELRAPLTAMRGYASLIEEEREATFESRTAATRIRQSTERLLAIVNDLLEVARIQSGRISTELCDTNVSDVITNVVAELKPSAAVKSITIAHTGTDEPHHLVTDQKRLHQILINLVSNAIKYTKEGRIEIAVTESRRDVEIRVKDTGMGIAAADQHKLFAPFFRVEQQSVQSITGTGLGMWITKQLIETLGGTVGVESIKDVGTNIVLTFPKQPAPQHPQAPQQT